MSVAPHKTPKSTAKANEDDFIDITDDSRSPQPIAGLAPYRTIRSTAQQAIRVEPPSQAPLLHSRSDGGTRHDPIVLDSPSPAKSQVTVDLTKPTYSIFAPPKPLLQALSQSKPKLGQVDNNILETPFPDAISQHVHGPQSQFVIPPLQFGRRVKMDEVIDVDGVSALSDLSAFRKNIINQDNNYLQHPIPGTVRIVQPPARDDYIKIIPNEHVRNHPAISHLVQLSNFPSRDTEPLSSTPSQDLWTDKWRPQRADHVLGNEGHALYLRDWLKALELQLESRQESPRGPQTKSNPKLKSTTTTFFDYEPTNGILKMKEGNANDRGAKRQRPRVVRAVQKIKGRKRQRVESDEEDWIVDTDDEMEEGGYADLREESEEDDGVEFCRKQKLSRLRRIESSPPPMSSSPPPQINHAPLFSSDLHNTLLLTGPPGSGKTAAIYACAKELDWDVFEVYPGVGRRNGLSLDQLVGEVGKNHLVRRAGVRKKDMVGKKDAFVEMFGRGKSKEKKANADAAGNGSEAELIEVDGVSGGEKHSSGDFGFVVSKDNVDSYPNAKEQGPEPIQRVRQSLILLEEVDILFEEDRGFWPAVVNIIKDCRRPVIMTCNGKIFPSTLFRWGQKLIYVDGQISALYPRRICRYRAYWSSNLVRLL